MTEGLKLRGVPDSLAELKRRLWLPAGAIDETLPRVHCNGALGLASGTLRLNGGAVIRAGVPVTSITFFTTAATVTQTNLWYCLVRESDNAVLAKTVDDGSTVWAINTYKTLAIAGGPHIPTADAAVWLGAVWVGTVGAATLQCCTLSNATFASLSDPGPWAVNANTGLTNPASLGATVTPGATAISDSYAYYS